jgi:hypothetical protein
LNATLFKLEGVTLEDKFRVGYATASFTSTLFFLQKVKAAKHEYSPRSAYVELNIVQKSRECSVDYGMRKKCADP